VNGGLVARAAYLTPMPTPHTSSCLAQIFERSLHYRTEAPRGEHSGDGTHPLLPHACLPTQMNESFAVGDVVLAETPAQPFPPPSHLPAPSFSALAFQPQATLLTLAPAVKASLRARVGSGGVGT
jgi:hypothetical protein